MLGEIIPRSSEIWPRPMGHHIFMWRLDKRTDGASLLIENNRFEDAPVGAAIYSVASLEVERDVTLKNNLYTKNDTLLIRFGGKDYTELEEYKRECKQDENSIYIINKSEDKICFTERKKQ